MDQEALLALYELIQGAGGPDQMDPDMLAQLLEVGPMAEEAGAANPHPETGEFSPYALFDYLEAYSQANPMEEPPMPEVPGYQGPGPDSAKKPPLGGTLANAWQNRPSVAKDATRAAGLPWKKNAGGMSAITR